MGAFYDVVYLRTEDRNQVRQRLEDLARKRKTRFLLAPPIRGWTAIYPANGGQDEKISKAIAKRSPADALHVLVHDDDVFCYFYYRADRLVDQYNSKPDYFETVSERTRVKLRGRPELLRDLFPDADSLKSIEAILHNADQPLFASESLEKFAKVLDLPNALSSYEYLMDGETDEIESWEQFLHVPDLSAERSAKRAQEDAIALEKRRLKDEGLLLVEKAGGGKGIESELPIFCPDRLGSGFLICWANGTLPTQCSLQHYAPPWSAGPQPVSIEFESSVWMLRASPSSRYLVTGHAFGTWKAQLWDLDQNVLVLEVPHSHAVTWADFSAEEKLLMSRSGEEVIVTSLETCKQLATYPVPGHGGRAALHPSGTKLVVDLQVNLAILDLRSGQLTSPLCVAERQDFTAMTLWMAGQLKEAQAQVDLVAMEKQLKKTLGKMGLAAAAIEGQLRQQVVQMQEALARFGTPEWVAGQVPVRGSERPSNLGFSTDGALFFCATSQGVRVYSWEEMLAAVEQMPRPLFAVDGRPYPHESRHGGSNDQGYTYALAYDERAHRLLFGGLGGTIDYLDVRTGQTGTLIESPGRPAVYGLTLTRDGSALACHAIFDFYERGNEGRSHLFQVWNYGTLSDKLGGEK